MSKSFSSIDGAACHGADRKTVHESLESHGSLGFNNGNLGTIAALPLYASSLNISQAPRHPSSPSLWRIIYKSKCSAWIVIKKRESRKKTIKEEKDEVKGSCGARLVHANLQYA